MKCKLSAMKMAEIRVAKMSSVNLVTNTNNREPSSAVMEVAISKMNNPA